MSIINFHKMHGCGNDFVIIDNRDYKLNFTKEKLKFFADRNKGIGCDQIIILENFPNYDCLMRIYNHDGSEAGNCGNAARCVASLLAHKMNNLPAIIKIKTITSSMTAKYYEDDKIIIDMGIPKFEWDEIPLSTKCEASNITVLDELTSGFAVNIGNPHIVYFIEDFTRTDLYTIGPKIENHKLFKEGVNVNFAQVVANDEINLKTWERGAGFTLACGSGACATAIAGISSRDLAKKIRVNMDGGSLIIQYTDDKHILMQGSATYVFKGEIHL